MLMFFLIVIFWGSLFLILHTYFFYPVSIRALALFIRKRYKVDKNYLPRVSIIISAYNEEKVIENTIKNFFCQNYPKGKFEIVIGSDASTDHTNEIVSKMAAQYSNIIFIPFEKRRGKKFVINDLIEKASGEILVFSDSNTIYNKDAVALLVQYYSDERIAGVSGQVILVEETGSTEAGNKEATYAKFESWVRDCEGRLGALIGANGGIYSIRKKFFVPMPDNIPVVDDLYIPLKVLEHNKDFVYCKKAIARETLAPSVKWESERKIRIIPRGIDTIKQAKKLLFNKRLIVSYGIWSHKIIRWLTPFLLILMFILNLILSIIHVNIFYDILLLLQVIIIFLGLIGYFLSKSSYNIKILLLCFYFFVANYATIVGFYRFLMKKHKPIWEPTPR